MFYPPPPPPTKPPTRWICVAFIHGDGLCFLTSPHLEPKLPLNAVELDRTSGSNDEITTWKRGFEAGFEAGMKRAAS